MKKEKRIRRKTRKKAKKEGKRKTPILSVLQKFHREEPEDREAIIGDNVELACRVDV